MRATSWCNIVSLGNTCVIIKQFSLNLTAAYLINFPIVVLSQIIIIFEINMLV